MTIRTTLMRCLGIAFSTWAAAAQPVGDDQVRAILRERVEVRKQSVGIVVGILDQAGPRVISYGRPSPDSSQSVDGDTIFEIGSVTKVFTAQLLAQSVARSEMRLDDPVSRYLPAAVKIPERSGKRITLHDLTSHRSGLPRLPGNLVVKDLGNPYADYTVADLYQFLSGYALPRDPGAEFEYSNLGVGLLGQVLAQQAKMSYPELVRQRILEPLGMKSTSVEVPAAATARFSYGHDAQRKRVPYWDLPALAGAGALRSTANDLLRFLAAHLGQGRSEPDPVLASMLAQRRPASGPMEIGLGWMIQKTPRGELVWHNGGTGGFQSFVGFDRTQRRGVVVLSNTQAPPGIDDIGRHLLDPSHPLAPAPAPRPSRTEITMTPETFDRFTGQYQLAPGAVLTITREDRNFFVQLTGQPRVPIFAMSPRSFFLKVVDAELEFELGESGPATSVSLRQNGVTQRARRLTAPPPERRSIEVDPSVLSGYEGQYRLSANLVIAITRDEGRLFAQLTGQPQVEIFAATPTTFFYRVVAAEIEFTVGPDGRAQKLTLRQGGAILEAARIP